MANYRQGPTLLSSAHGFVLVLHMLVLGPTWTFDPLTWSAAFLVSFVSTSQSLVLMGGFFILFDHVNETLSIGGEQKRRLLGPIIQSLPCNLLQGVSENFRGVTRMAINDLIHHGKSSWLPFCR